MSPMRRDAYPANWNEISARVRQRNGGRCEQCDAPNGKYIVRSMDNPYRFLVVDDEIGGYRYPSGELLRMSEIPNEYTANDGREVKVVLTVHHIGVDKPDGTPGDSHDKMDCRDENLISLCQRCHLIADLPHHIQNARATRNQRKNERIAATGQRSLFDE